MRMKRAGTVKSVAVVQPFRPNRGNGVQMKRSDRPAATVIIAMPAASYSAAAAAASAWVGIARGSIMTAARIASAPPVKAMNIMSKP